MSDMTITIENADIVDAAACRVMMEGDLSSSDAASRRVYGEASRRVYGEASRRVYAEASVPAQRLDSAVVTVKATGRSAYAYCARAARRLLRSFTVKARAFAVAVESRVRAFLMNVFPKTGADILRQSAILNI